MMLAFFELAFMNTVSVEYRYLGIKLSNVQFQFLINALCLPELDVEQRTEGHDNHAQNDVPSIPTGAGGGLLLRVAPYQVTLTVLESRAGLCRVW
jgi:hypothetical protein